MKFVVKASAPKRILYAILNAVLIIFLCFWIYGLVETLQEENTLGGLILLIIMWLSLAILFICAIVMIMSTMHLVITVDSKNKTLTIKKILRNPVTISVYDILKWKIKIQTGRNGENGRTMYIYYNNTRVLVSSILDNWEKLRIYLLDNCEKKLLGDVGREVTAYSFIADKSDNEIFKDSENVGLNYEDRITNDAFFALSKLMPSGYFSDLTMFKHEKGSIPGSFTEFLKDAWAGEDNKEYMDLIDKVDITLKKDNSRIQDFVVQNLSFLNIKQGALKKGAAKFERSILKALGHPICSYSLEQPLSPEVKQALEKLLLDDDILQMFFIEYKDYVVFARISRLN